MSLRAESKFDPALEVTPRLNQPLALGLIWMVPRFKSCVTNTHRPGPLSLVGHGAPQNRASTGDCQLQLQHPKSLGQFYTAAGDLNSICDIGLGAYQERFIDSIKTTKRSMTPLFIPNHCRITIWQCACEDSAIKNPNPGCIQSLPVREALFDLLSLKLHSLVRTLSK